MNSNFSNTSNNIQFSNSIDKNYNHHNISPSRPYAIVNSLNQKNLQYFPIKTKETFDEQHTIYLAAEDSNNLNDNSSTNQCKFFSTNNNNKNNKIEYKLLLPQRSIEFQIKKTKFEYMLNFPVKNETQINNKKDSNENDNNNQKNYEKTYSTNKDEKIKEEKGNSNNNREDFILSIKNINDSNIVPKRLIHSYSLDNYSDLLNKSISSFHENLEKSAILKDHFIKGMRDSKRKDSLLKAIEKYKRIKSLGKINVNNQLNNSFTSGLDYSNINICNNKYRQKSIERIYSMKNNYNIILEDENENSDGETIKKNSDSKINENNNSNNKKVKNQKMIYKDIKENIKENMEDIQMKNLENMKKIKKAKIKGNSRKYKLKVNNKLIDNEEKKNEEKDKINDNFKNKNINKVINNYIDKMNISKNNFTNQEIKKSIENEELIFQNSENINLNKNNDEMKYINNSINDEVNRLNSKINRNNNINNNINNNNNININNIDNNLIINENSQVIPKILRKEHYIIDDRGQQKLFEINEKKNKINLINSNRNVNNNNYINIDDKIMEKERYHRKNKIILISNRKNDNNEFSRKSDYNFKGTKEKIIKNNSAISPYNIYLQSKTQNNSKGKELQKINSKKSNNLILMKKSENNYKKIETDITKYQHKDIDNNLNHLVYIPNQISPNPPLPTIKRYQISKTEQRKKSTGSKNHSYHEICSISTRKFNTTSKTIYHDYSNIDKKLLTNYSSKDMTNTKGNALIIGEVLNRNYSLTNIQKTTFNRGKQKLLGNNINKKIKTRYIVENNKVIDNTSNDIKYNYKYSRNENNINNRNKIYNSNLAQYNKNIEARYINTFSSRNQNYLNFNKYTNNSKNDNYIKPENNAVQRIKKFNHIIKNNYSNYNFINQDEE